MSGSKADIRSAVRATSVMSVRAWLTSLVWPRWTLQKRVRLAAFRTVSSSRPTSWTWRGFGLCASSWKTRRPMSPHPGP